MSTPIDEQIEYIEKLFCGESEKMKLSRQKAAEYGKPDMPVSPLEGRLLSWLVGGVNPQKVIEVGTFTGYSAQWILEAMPPDGVLYSLEKQSDWAEASREIVADDRVQILEGDAVETLKGLESEGPFDVIFIDANKAAYVNYLNWAWEHVRVGGLIIGDNTFLFGGVYGEPRFQSISEKQIRVMKEFNQSMADHPDFDSFLFPTLQGMTVARRCR